MRWGVHYLKYKTSLWHAAGLRFHRWGFSLLGLAMIGLVWAGIGYLEKVEQGGAELAAMRTADNLARAFERHFYDGLNEVDRLLTAMRKSYTEHPKDFNFQLWAPSEHSLDDRILLLSIAGPDGIIKLTNLTSNSASRIDLSELDHF